MQVKTGGGPSALPDGWMIDQLFLFVLVLDAEEAGIMHEVVGEDLLLHCTSFGHLGEIVENDHPVDWARD